MQRLATLHDFEDHLFTVAQRNVTARGFYLPDEFLLVGNWKSPRPFKFYLQNRGARIQQLSRAAFVNAREAVGQLVPTDEPWNVLDALRGVGIPVASALLTVWQPDEFTVIDWRALDTLTWHGETAWDDKAGLAVPFSNDQRWWEGHYDLYVRGCRAIAQRADRPLRKLDKALWRWSRESPQPRAGHNPVECSSV